MTSDRLCEVCGSPLQIEELNRQNRLHRCSRCGHVVRSLTEAPAAQRSHAWGGVGAFDKLRTALTWWSQRLYLRRNHRPFPPYRVLEIGFGAGLLLRRYVQRHVHCTGVEAHLLETPLTAGLVESIDYQKCRAEEMVLSDNAFDLIYAIHVAEHLSEPAVVFEKAFRAMAPGGVLHLLTPNGESSGLKLFGAAWWNLEDPTHIRFYSPESITRQLAAAGFEEIVVRQPRWDSLLLEGSSAARLWIAKPGDHGVLSHKWGRWLALLTAPFFLLARLLFPNLSPSIEVFARKGAQKS